MGTSSSKPLSNPYVSGLNGVGEARKHLKASIEKGDLDSVVKTLEIVRVSGLLYNVLTGISGRYMDLSLSLLQHALDRNKVDIVNQFIQSMISSKLTAAQVQEVFKGRRPLLCDNLFYYMTRLVIAKSISFSVMNLLLYPGVIELIKRKKLTEDSVVDLLKQADQENQSAISLIVSSPGDNVEMLTALLGLVLPKQQKIILASSDFDVLAKKNFNLKIWAKICEILEKPDASCLVEMSQDVMSSLAEEARNREPLTLSPIDYYQTFEVIEGSRFRTRSRYFPILWAIKNSHVELVKALAKLEGADLTVGLDGITPLLVAVETNNVEMLKCVLECLGADLSKGLMADTNASVLYEVSSRQNLEMCQLLVASGLAVNTPEPHTRQTALFAARTPELVNYLIDARASVHVRDVTGASPIIDAAANGLPEKVSLLLAAGANFRLEDDKGLTALDHALAAGNVKCARLLVAAGATANFEQALLEAIHDNNDAMVSYLVGLGVNVDETRDAGAAAEGRSEGLTALMCAVKQLAKLFEPNSDPSCIMKDISSNYRVIRSLLLAGADVTLVNTAGKTALQMAQAVSHKFNLGVQEAAVTHSMSAAEFEFVSRAAKALDVTVSLLQTHLKSRFTDQLIAFAQVAYQLGLEVNGRVFASLMFPHIAVPKDLDLAAAERVTERVYDSVARIYVEPDKRISLACDPRVSWQFWSKIHRAYLWENRNEHPKLRRAFDEECGLLPYQPKR